MKELLYLLLGWLLGLLGPRIVEAIKAHYVRKELAIAIRLEAKDLQYRLACSSFLIAIRDGNISKEYLNWIKPIFETYSGNESTEIPGQFISLLLGTNEDQRLKVVEMMREKPDVGLRLKKYTANLIESSLTSFNSFPVDYQRYVHEFRNQHFILNQEIDQAIESCRMSFDSSLTVENHDRLINDLNDTYKTIYKMYRRTCDRLQALIDYDLKNI